MKIRNLILVLSALALPLQAAEVGTSYLSLPVAVKQAESKMVGIFLARPVLLKGQIANAVSNNATSFTAVGTSVFNSYTAADESTSAKVLAPASDDLYIVELTSGPYNGLVKQVGSFSGSTLTLKSGDGFPALPANTTFILRKDNTLASVFGEGANVSIATGTSTANADTISVIDSGGAYRRFFYRTGSGWRYELDRGATGANRANVRLSLGTGILFKSYLNKNIYLSGEYRGTRSLINTSDKGTIVAYPYPVAVKLKDCGLKDYLYQNIDPGLADELKFLDSGSFVSVFHNGTNFLSVIARSNNDDRVLDVGGAFIAQPGVPEMIAFSPQVITK